MDCLATYRIYGEMIREDWGRSGARFDHGTLGPALTMQLRGLRVDFAAIKSAKEETESEAKRLKKEFEAIIGPWKWAKGWKPAPVSLAKLLYGKMGVKPHFNRDGNFTIDKEAISKILEDPKTPEEAYEICSIAQQLEVLEEDRKVLNKEISPDGRFHATYSVHATTTGRWSVRKNHFNEGANLHALSKRLHKIFIPDDGYILVNLDQKQGESKIISYLSGCRAYKEAHRAGNTHVAIGKFIFPEFAENKKIAEASKLPWDENKNYYYLFKTIQHATNLGETPFNLARRTHAKVAQATEWQNKYFSAFPEILDWQREIANKIKIYHYLTTPFGQVRHFLGRTWDKQTIKEALSYLPQFTCSQINKIILWRLWNYFDNGEDLMILHENHDSVLFQIKNNNSGLLGDVLNKIKLQLPIRGDILEPEYEAKWGFSWGEEDLKEIENYGA